jgi:hypothetical protein
MYCRNCGAKIEDTAEFCPHCGRYVTGLTVAPKNEQKEAENRDRASDEKAGSGTSQNPEGEKREGYEASREQGAASSGGNASANPNWDQTQRRAQLDAAWRASSSQTFHSEEEKLAFLHREGIRSGFAIASIVLGGIGLITAIIFVPSVLAFVFGILVLTRHIGGEKERRDRILAVIAINLGVIGILLGILFYVVFADTLRSNLQTILSQYESMISRGGQYNL